MDVRTRDYTLHPARKAKWKYMYLKYKAPSLGTLQVKARGDLANEFATQEDIDMGGTSPGLGPTGTFTLGVSTLGGNTITKDRVTFAHIVATMLGVQFKETTAYATDIYDFQILGQLKGYRDD